MEDREVIQEKQHGFKGKSFLTNTMAFYDAVKGRDTGVISGLQ